MIIEEGKMREVQMGTGDINVGAGWIDSETPIAVVLFSEKEPGPIGVRVMHPAPGIEFPPDTTPVRLSFTDERSIDVVIRNLQDAKKYLRQRKGMSFPESDPERGLYNKYQIIKRETGQEAEGEYFVLKPAKDPAARAALVAYAEATSNEQLGIDILKWLSSLPRLEA